MVALSLVCDSVIVSAVSAEWLLAVKAEVLQVGRIISIFKHQLHLVTTLVLFLPLSKLLPLLIHISTIIPLWIEDFERVAMGALVLPQRLVLFALWQQLNVQVQGVATSICLNVYLITRLCKSDKLAVVFSENSISLVHWLVKITKCILTNNFPLMSFSTHL